MELSIGQPNGWLFGASSRTKGEDALRGASRDCDFFCLSAVGAVVRQRRWSEAGRRPCLSHREARGVVPAWSEWRLSWKWLLVPALASLVVITVIWRRSAQTEKLVASAPISAVGAQRSPEAVPQIPFKTPEKQQVRSWRSKTCLAVVGTCAKLGLAEARSTVLLETGCERDLL